MSPADPCPCRVLFVCLGNICRSPMAAAMAQKRFGDRIVAESAGLRPVYDAATPEAVAAMRERGLDITAHQSRNLHHLELQRYDLIVALTPAIAAGLPRANRSQRVVVWDVDDPYGGDLAVYRACARTIESRLRDLVLPARGGSRPDRR